MWESYTQTSSDIHIKCESPLSTIGNFALWQYTLQALCVYVEYIPWCCSNQTSKWPRSTACPNTHKKKYKELGIFCMECKHYEEIYAFTQCFLQCWKMCLFFEEHRTKECPLTAWNRAGCVYMYKLAIRSMSWPISYGYIVHKAVRVKTQFLEWA